ncbi:hypothetical protein ACFLS0_04095 [Candidatus Bipolaricaulota bacterium]
MKRVLALTTLLVCITASVLSATPGLSFGIQIGAGLAGSMSYFEVGVILPKINDKVFVDIKLRWMSSITWVTFVNMETSETVSFHPVVVGAVVSVGSIGPLVDDEFRVYGGSDILLGYSFTPYDSLAYGVGNLIPPNLTFGVWGHFGFDYFTSETSSVYIQSGGGFKSLLVEDKKNAYAVASSWLGSGFGIQMGSRFHW